MRKCKQHGNVGMAGKAWRVTARQGLARQRKAGVASFGEAGHGLASAVRGRHGYAQLSTDGPQTEVRGNL